MEMTCTPPEEVPVKPDEVKVPVKPDEAAAITTATQTRRYLDLEPRGCEDHLVVCDDGSETAKAHRG
uniref:Transposase n=1 Tax=Globodera pallida TaxID=36090 RepID=A0A183CSZ6_GLOPA